MFGVQLTPTSSSVVLVGLGWPPRCPSLWDFTNVVMNFLLEGKTGKDMDHSWLQYFDVVGVYTPHIPHPPIIHAHLEVSQLLLLLLLPILCFLHRHTHAADSASWLSNGTYWIPSSYTISAPIV